MPCQEAKKKFKNLATDGGKFYAMLAIPHAKNLFVAVLQRH